MPIFNRIASAVTKPFPRVISPTAHAAVDYIRVGLMAGSAALFWRHSKRAAVAAFICAAAEVSVNLLTDYDGHSGRMLDLNTHEDLELGMAALTASMPEFLRFSRGKEKNFFLSQGALSVAVNGLTRFSNQDRSQKKKMYRALASRA